jgi:hypothetical protein
MAGYRKIQVQVGYSSLASHICKIGRQGRSEILPCIALHFVYQSFETGLSARRRGAGNDWTLILPAVSVSFTGEGWSALGKLSPASRSRNRVDG